MFSQVVGNDGGPIIYDTVPGTTYSYVVASEDPILQNFFQNSTIVWFLTGELVGGSGVLPTVFPTATASTTGAATTGAATTGTGASTPSTTGGSTTGGASNGSPGNQDSSTTQPGGSTTQTSSATSLVSSLSALLVASAFLL